MRSSRWRRWAAIGAAAGVIGAHACHRDDRTIALAAPFDADAKVGELSATWTTSTEERAFADGVRLKAPQVRVAYRVQVRNHMSDKVYVRVGGFQLVDRNGVPLGTDTAAVECAAAKGTTEGVLEGDVWVAKDAVAGMVGFRLSQFAVPLNDLGRALYKQWRTEGRPESAAEVDAEVARYAAAPPCPSR